jgi:hypothetical protein
MMTFACFSTCYFFYRCNTLHSSRLLKLLGGNFQSGQIFGYSIHILLCLCLGKVGWLKSLQHPWIAIWCFKANTWLTWYRLMTQENKAFFVMQDVVLHVPAVCKLANVFWRYKVFYCTWRMFVHIAQLELATRTISSHSRVIVWYWILFNVLQDSFWEFQALQRVWLFLKGQSHKMKNFV